MSRTVICVSHATGADGTDLGRLVAERLGFCLVDDEKQATKSIGANDAGRADYLKRFYGVAEELPTHYDLAVNTDRIPADK